MRLIEDGDEICSHCSHYFPLEQLPCGRCLPCADRCIRCSRCQGMFPPKKFKQPLDREPWCHWCQVKEGVLWNETSHTRWDARKFGAKGDIPVEQKESVWGSNCPCCGTPSFLGEKPYWCCRNNEKDTVPEHMFPQSTDLEFLDLLERTPARLLRRINSVLSLFQTTPRVRSSYLGLISYPSNVGVVNGGLRVVPRPYNQVVAFNFVNDELRGPVPQDLMEEWVSIYRKSHGLGSAISERHRELERQVGESAAPVTLRTRNKDVSSEGVTAVLAGLTPGKRMHYETRFQKEIGSWSWQNGYHQKAMYTPNLDSLMFPLLFWGGSAVYSGFSAEKLKRKYYVRQISAHMDAKSEVWRRLGEVKQEWMCVHALLEDDIRLQRAEKHTTRKKWDEEKQQWQSRLPPTYPGSESYIADLRSQGLHICRQRGPPTWFLTLTASQEWPELQELGIDNIYSAPDIVNRLFMITWNNLIEKIKKGEVFGHCTFLLGALEFQFRGTIHGHLLIGSSEGPQSLEEIDEYVCASYADLAQGDKDLVRRYMVHKCGPHCLSADGECRKGFPVDLGETRLGDVSGRVYYRRSLKYDEFLAPTNLALLRYWQGHVNLDFTDSSAAIAYLYKYIWKRRDSVDFIDFNGDEISRRQQRRAFSSSDAIFTLSGHQRYIVYPKVLKYRIERKWENLWPQDDGRRFRGGRRLRKARNTEQLLGGTDSESDIESNASEADFELLDEFKQRRIAQAGQRAQKLSNGDEDINVSDAIGIYLDRPRMDILDIPFVELFERFKVQVTLERPQGAGSIQFIYNNKWVTVRELPSAKRKAIMLEYEKPTSILYWFRLSLYTESFRVGDAASSVQMLKDNEASTFSLESAKRMMNFLSSTQVSTSEFRQYFLQLLRANTSAKTCRSTFDQYKGILIENVQGVFGLQQFLYTAGVSRALIKYVTRSDVFPSAPKELLRKAVRGHFWSQIDVQVAEKRCKDTLILIKKKEEQLRVWRMLNRGRSEQALLLLKCRQGRGKTFLLQTLEYHHRSKEILSIFCGITHAACMNYTAAITVHELINLSGTDPGEDPVEAEPRQIYFQLIREADWLIIDEALSADLHLVEELDRVCRSVRGSPDLVCGGLNVVLAGCDRQLSTVVPPNPRLIASVSPLDVRDKSILARKELGQFRVETIAERIRNNNSYGVMVDKLADGFLPHLDMQAVGWTSDTTQLLQDVLDEEREIHLVVFTHRQRIKWIRRLQQQIVDDNPDIQMFTFYPVLEKSDAGLTCLGNPQCFQHEWSPGAAVPDYEIKFWVGARIRLRKKYLGLAKGTPLRILQIQDDVILAHALETRVDVRISKTPWVVIGASSGPTIMWAFPITNGHVHVAHTIQGANLGGVWVDGSCGIQPWCHEMVSVIMGRVAGWDRIGFFLTEGQIEGGATTLNTIVFDELLVENRELESSEIPKRIQYD